MRWRVVLATLAAVIGGSPVQAAAPQWRSHVDVIAQPGNARSIGKLDFFVPLFQGEDTLAYGDFRAMFSDDPSREGNFGAGFRHIVRDGPFGVDSIFGAYAFFDASSTPYDNTFYQVSGGLEWLTSNFEFRVNGYLPENKQYTISSLSSSTVSVGVSGTVAQTTTTTATSSLVEQSMPGFDVEAGMRVPLFGTHGLWLYGGYFQFRRDDLDVSGPRFRVELPIDHPFGRLGTQLTVGAEIQNDAVRGTQAFGLVRLRIPLGPPTAAETRVADTAAIEQRMTAYVQRDNDVVAPAATVTGNTTVTAAVTDPGSGETVNIFHVAQGAAATDCSQANPCDLATAKAAAGSGDVIVLRDAGGTVTETSALDLAARQQLIGGGSTGTAAITLASGDRLTLTGLGGRPTLNNISAGGGFATNPVVRLATGGVIRGVALTGGDSGVTIPGADGITMIDVSVGSTNGAGQASAFMRPAPAISPSPTSTSLAYRGRTRSGCGSTGSRTT